MNTQFKPKIYYYPLNCDNKITPNNKNNITCAAKTAKTGWCCSATDKMITEIQIPGQTNEISSITPVPEPYQQLIVELTIENAEVAKWKKEQWTSKMANVEKNLRNNKEYAEAFKNVNVKVLGVYSAQ
ncbi:unnamed protein product [Cylicostephanus goldi]|uniref:Uncharacterized protein n=1 Tax=Cylicostephanus goldi TaxID=71465 RepID=A0A3P6REJ9_CYLGO|nr:unnamed protein product [Cylicostephanus goldi]